MSPKTSAKKSSKKKKLITVEIRKEIIGKHEKGTRVVDLPNNNNPPPPSFFLRTNHPIFKVIKFIKPVYIISFVFSLKQIFFSFVRSVLRSRDQTCLSVLVANPSEVH